MKVRWNRESIRLRITPTEFDAITAGRAVHEGIEFPGTQFWNVTLQAADAETTIASDQRGVSVSLSEADRAALADPEAEGVYFQADQPAALRYYVEKDFPCVHKPAPAAGEGVSETFTPPSGFEARKLAPTEINGD
jgi:hypothetical protein